MAENKDYEVVDMYCVKCRQKVESPGTFRTPESLRRYMATGVCQQCQDLDDRRSQRLAELNNMMKGGTRDPVRRKPWHRHYE